MWEKIEKCVKIEKTEGYPSGWRGLIANEIVRGNLERGFKSLTLRHFLFDIFFVFYIGNIVFLAVTNVG